MKKMLNKVREFDKRPTTQVVKVDSRQVRIDNPNLSKFSKLIRLSIWRATIPFMKHLLKFNGYYDYINYKKCYISFRLPHPISEIRTSSDKFWET